ncbi:hypothetical protein WMF40_21095 [Sorangium sp. So ce854]
MNTVTINPSRVRQFGGAEGAVFCLVTNPELMDRLVIGDVHGYAGSMIIPFSQGDTFDRILAEEIPGKAHVLVISPAAFFQSPPPETLGQGRKLLAMACNSTPTPWEAIHHFVRVVEETDPVAQQRFTDRFFVAGEAAEYLELVDPTHGTRARFDHKDDRYLWNEQVGTLGWGEQQLAPSGEISVLPLHIWDFDFSLFLEVNGTIALRGYPILHNGTPSFMRSDQRRIHERLATIEQSALIATVEHGTIVDVEATHESAQPALAMLNSMFDVDSRFRLIWEIGFAINTQSRMLPGNLAMNETYGARNGAIHFGLGLTPHTQYHLDIICPGTTVLTSQGSVLLGDPAPPREAGGGLRRVRGDRCACLE